MRSLKNINNYNSGSEPKPIKTFHGGLEIQEFFCSLIHSMKYAVL